MKRNNKEAERPRGRPRSFDREAALERAMQVFWQHGYEATSISDLTEAMGINPPSLYAAFGDKERLFLECLERYKSGAGGQAQNKLEQAPTARQAVETLLDEAAFELTSSSHPSGCMLVLAATNCSAESASVQQAVASMRGKLETALTARIARGIADGELVKPVEAAQLSKFYATVLYGMSIQSRDGASREALRATARLAMQAWPQQQR
jgi:AcrR family transcriptional regulator